MISVWVDQFMRDEDLCLVDYRAFKPENDVDFPEVSFCFADPIIEDELWVAV